MKDHLKRHDIIRRRVALEISRANRRIAALEAEQDIISAITFDPKPPKAGSFTYWDRVTAFKLNSNTPKT